MVLIFWRAAYVPVSKTECNLLNLKWSTAYCEKLLWSDLLTKCCFPLLWLTAFRLASYPGFSFKMESYCIHPDLELTQNSSVLPKYDRARTARWASALHKMGKIITCSYLYFSLQGHFPCVLPKGTPPAKRLLALAESLFWIHFFSFLALLEQKGFRSNLQELYELLS